MPKLYIMRISNNNILSSMVGVSLTLLSGIGIWTILTLPNCSHSSGGKVYSEREDLAERVESMKEWIEEDRNSGALSVDVYQYYADNMNEIQMLIENL